MRRKPARIHGIDEDEDEEAILPATTDKNTKRSRLIKGARRHKKDSAKLSGEDSTPHESSAENQYPG